MEYTEREAELACGYLKGEYTDVQLNYLAHQCGSTRERMEEILEEMAAIMPLATAAKFILICIFSHFVFCTVIALASFFRG